MDGIVPNHHNQYGSGTVQENCIQQQQINTYVFSFVLTFTEHK